MFVYQNNITLTIRSYFQIILSTFFLLVCCELIYGTETLGKERIDLNGTLIKQKKDPDISRNISAIAIRGDLLVVGSDEGADILIFTKKSAGKYIEAKSACIALDGKKCGQKREGTEIDIEGLAWSNRYLYVIGSHSRARSKVKAKKSAKENRKRLASIKTEPTREQLFRLELDDNGGLVPGSKINSISLATLFSKHQILALFQPIPSKENGIDIEGLAVTTKQGVDRLYLGFRGPVLRGNHAVVMVLEFQGGTFTEAAIKTPPKIHFLNLQGRGIRGMTELDSGELLLLAGPVGDARLGNDKTNYQVYVWDAKDDDLTNKARSSLCNIPVSKEAKAEGIALLNTAKKTTDAYQFAVVFDGEKKGKTTIFTCQ